MAIQARAFGVRFQAAPPTLCPHTAPAPREQRFPSGGGAGGRDPVWSGGTGAGDGGGARWTPTGSKYLTERDDLVSLWRAGPGYGKVGDLAARALGVPTLFARGSGPYIQTCRDLCTRVDVLVAPPSLPRLPGRRGREDVYQAPVCPGQPRLTRSLIPKSGLDVWSMGASALPPGQRHSGPPHLVY